MKMVLVFTYSFAALIHCWSSILTTLRRASKRNRFIARWMVLDLVLKLLSLLAIFFNESFFIGSQYFNANYLLYSLDSIMNVFVVHLYPFVFWGFRGSMVKPISSIKKTPLIVQTLDENAFSDKEKELLYKLNSLLEVGQLYTDEELSPGILASKISCKETTLEQIVQKKFKMDTKELIDFYRINYLIEREQRDERFKKQNKESKSAQAGFKTQIAMEAAKKKFGTSKD
jgi:hypothetical protein